MSIDFIERNPEKILQETITYYEGKIEDTLGDADAERLIIDTMAYREVLMRELMQRIMSQNFVQTASTPFLDNWGLLFGILRNANEDDAQYRQRILKGVGSVAVGTRDAYYQRITSLEDVADVAIETKQDDVTLPPGVTRLYPIIKQEDSNGITWGSTHNTTIEQVISDYISDRSFGIIGEQFVYDAATPVAINGSVQLRLFSGTNHNTAIDAVNDVVNRYLASLSLKFKGVFDVYELERRVRQVDGVQEQSVLTFNNIPNLNNKEFIQRGQIDISVL